MEYSILNFSQESMAKVCTNAYQQYCRSRPAASSDSNRRVKNLSLHSAGINPIFTNLKGITSELTRESLLDKMKNYRPQGVIYFKFFKMFFINMLSISRLFLKFVQKINLMIT